MKKGSEREKNRVEAGEDDYDPHENRVIAKPLTNFDACISVLKSVIGTGTLAMPMAFKNSGWLNGTIGTFAIGIICTYAFHILYQNMYIMCKRDRVPTITYTKSIQTALSNGPPCMKAFSGISGVLVDLFLFMFYFGVCAVYIVFTAENIKLVVEDHVDITLDIRCYIAMLTLPLLMVFFIRTLKNLVPFSIIATLLIFIGFACILYYIFSGLPEFSGREAFGDIADYPLFFGVLLFAFSSPGLMISIGDSMKTPKDYLGLFGVLNFSVLIILILNAVFAFFGYWRYGDEVKGSVTLNIPEHDIIPKILQVIFAIAIFLSYPLNGYVAIEVIWTIHLSKSFSEEKFDTGEYIVRLIFVPVTVLFGVACPKLGPFIALVGALCVPNLAIIFPAIVDICMKHEEGYGPAKIHLIVDILLIIFGLVGCALGSLCAVRDIIAMYQND